MLAKSSVSSTVTPQAGKNPSNLTYKQPRPHVEGPRGLQKRGSRHAYRLMCAHPSGHDVPNRKQCVPVTFRLQHTSGSTDEWNVISAERAECSYLRNLAEHSLEPPDQTILIMRRVDCQIYALPAAQATDCGEPRRYLAFPPMRFRG
jgi:hypothetical protein